MSITGALNNAISGLTAASKSSQVVSNNIANASTPGYGPRTISLTSATGGFGGVRIADVSRFVDPLILAERRAAGSENAYRSALSDFITTQERGVGTPDQLGSLSGQIAYFESKLIEAASRPDANERLTVATEAAKDLANSLNNTSAQIQEMRSQADRSIGNQITRLNNILEEITELNAAISKSAIKSEESAGFLDQRQLLIDEVSELVPVRVFERERGVISLYTPNGTALLDPRPSQFEFSASNVVTANLSYADGELSGLRLNGVDLRISGDNAALAGGAIAANFEIRDSLGTEAQTQIDAMARNLIERFQDPAVDPTLGVGDPGLFTDGGLAFDPLDEEGIAERIAINSAVDPSQGGAVWRLRDGMNAVAPGEVGNAALLQALSDAMSVTQVPASGNFGTGQFSFSSLSSALISDISTDRLHADQRLSFTATRLAELTERELAAGVDTDAELQRLIIIEQAYAANVQVIQTAEEMIDALLRI